MAVRRTYAGGPCWRAGCMDCRIKSGNDDSWPASPAALHAQACRQIAAKQMLTEMHQLAIAIAAPFTADRARAMVEGDVLGQITAALPMHHAIEDTPVHMCL